MYNILFLTLDDNTLFECEGGAPWSTILKLIEAAGITDAIIDFGAGLVAGFKDAFK